MIKNYFSPQILKQNILSTLFSIFLLSFTFAQQTATIVTNSSSPNWNISLSGNALEWTAIGPGINQTANGNDPIFDFSANIDNEEIEITVSSADDFNSTNYIGITDDWLSRLDISKLINVSGIYINSVSLKELDLNNNISLTALRMPVSPLGALDLSQNINLEIVEVEGGEFTKIDLSNSPKLSYFSLESKNFTSLNIKNGSNPNIEWFRAIGPLICIQVDDVEYSYQNWNPPEWVKPDYAYYSSSSCPDKMIPDPNFEQALIDLGIDTDGTINGFMNPEDALGVEKLNVENKNIENLTGIMLFKDLIELNCSNNNLSELTLLQDIREPQEGLYTYKAPYTNLDCSQNQLTSLNMTNNFNIEFLNCSNNNLTGLSLPPDFILGMGGQYQLAMLKDLNCSNNKLTVLELQNSASVINVDCSFNEITNINFPRTIYEYWGEPRLTNLNCSNNNLTELKDENISTGPGLGVLTEINCDSNNLTKIVGFRVGTLSCNDNNLGILSNIAVNDDYLTALSCTNNKFQELDFSYFANLNDLNVSNNELTSLNLVKNNYQGDVNGNVVTTGNENLYCIQVLNPNAANQGIAPYDNFSIDDYTNFSYSGGCKPIAILSSDKQTILENGEEAIITCSLNLRTQTEVSINLTTSGTAPSTNYELSSNQIVIPAGELSGSVTLTAKEDQMETDKTVIFEIASIENAEEETPQQVTVTIIHVNDPPTDINLQFTEFEENVEFDELTKIIVDDIDDTTHTITLVEGDGSDDNDNFFVVGDMLHTKIIFDYEDQKEHFIRLKAEDSGGLSIEKSFVITVINENELVITGVVTNNYCDEGDISSIVTTVSGQYAPPLSYQWSSGETTPDISGKPNGTYTLTVSDAAGDSQLKDFTISSEPVYAAMSICYVTSDEASPDNNRIYFNNTGAYNIENIVILREGIVAGLYDVIGAVNPDQPSFLDTSSDNQVVSYNYKVQVTDKCGGISESSAQHKTVLLQASKAADGSINLNWNAYVGLNYGTYDIYRQENNADFALLTSLPSSNQSYNDTGANSNTQSYSYYIGITLNETCDFTAPTQASKSLLADTQIKSNIKLIGSTLGVDDEVLSKSVKIFPNPVEDILTIESPMLEITKVEIFSLLGATLKDVKDDFGTIYMDDLSKGIYMIKIQSEYGTTVKKLIKQ